jgi:hypothetical protein
MGVKPCASGTTVTAGYEAFRSRHGDVDAAILAAADPRACAM